ncbi:MAG: hypothetical protein K2O49_02225, partial [Muribaculaceae bacterium]|nr:hypothetical protein [Muribaculaceae bacterium]
MNNQSDTSISPATPSTDKVNQGDDKKHDISKDAVKKYLGTGLRYIVPLGISVGLILWLFHKVNYHEVVKIIHE